VWLRRWIMDKKQKPKTVKLKKTNSKVFVSLITGAIILLGLAQIIVANRLVTQGELIKQYEIEAQEITGENRRIESEIVKLSSLSYIASQSACLGMARTFDVVYILGSIPIAMERR
jgi:cell division protein FtsL